MAKDKPGSLFGTNEIFLAVHDECSCAVFLDKQLQYLPKR